MNRPFEISFDNQEAVPHNVAFYESKDADTPPILPPGQTPLFPGPKTATYKLPALKAGSYFFRCDAHPSAMTGQARRSVTVRSASRWRSRKPGPRPPPTRRTASALGATRSWTG